MFHLWINQVVAFYVTVNVTLPQVFFKHFARESQLPGFCINGALVENGLVISLGCAFGCLYLCCIIFVFIFVFISYYLYFCWACHELPLAGCRQRVCNVVCLGLGAV